MFFPLVRLRDMAIFSKADAVVQLDLDIKIDWLKRSADLKGMLFPVV